MTLPTHVTEPETSTTETKDLSSVKSNLKGDWLNFFLLILLYTMQGIPIGLASVIPIIMQSKKNVSYNDQTLFSLVMWPFCLKLIWAPLVDAVYIQKIGRRKTWLIPVQFLMGACFLYLANNIDDLLPETGKPNILKLVCVLFLAKIMAATQDIAVDGWALTMLRKNNVGYASTCNATGQVMGIMIGSVFTVLFTSEDFCNKYLRFTNGTGGIVSMKSLFYAWGIMFIIITSLIAIFKKEKDNRLEENYVKLNVIQNYLLLWDILKLPSIQIFALTLLTAKIGFAATDNVSILKLIDAGVSKDDIMIINTAMFVIKAIIPLIVGKYTSGPKPMTIYLNIAPFRLLWNISFVALIYYTPKIIKHNGVIDIPIYYYVILVFIVAVHDMLSNIMIIATLAFFSRISDSRFGGTYMTLLNTLTNIGGAWTQSVSLGLVDLLSFNECTNNVKNDCSTLSLQSTCKINGGQCVDVNGYYVETAMCTILGVIWLSIFGKILKKLQTRSLSSWLVNVKPPVKENNKDICNLTVMS